MKKELLYLILPIILTVAGIFYKSVFLSDITNKTYEILALNNESVAKYNRDSLVQNNLSEIVDLYNKNKRDTRTYGEIVADLLKITEGLLQKSSIEYKGNDINQEFDEKKDIKSGTTTFVIHLYFTTDYFKLMKFISLIEKNELFIRVPNLEISRIKGKKKSNSDEEFDEFNLNELLEVSTKLEFIKYL